MQKNTRLAVLLFRSLGALIVLNVLAVALPLAGLVRTSSLLSKITDVQMADLDAEEAIHRAAWRVEVVLRHAARACLSDPNTDAAALTPSMVAASRDLLDMLQRNGGSAQPRLLQAARRYHSLVERAVQSGACTAHRAYAPERLALDEELTNAWIEQLRGIHVALSESEQQARRTVAGATALAIVVGIGGALAAGYVANRAARRVTAPLAAVSAAAVRLGSGDFTAVERSHGITEISALTEALDGMRRDLEALDRMKQQLLTSVSHELHTPLTKLREALGLLGDGTAGPLTPRQQRVVTLAQDACEREVRIVNELLDISRLRSGQPLRLQVGCQIQAVLRAAIDDERQDARERGVEIAILSEGPVPPLTLDVPLIERAVANLVRNAVSVSPRGAAVRLLHSERAPSGGPAGRFVCVDIEDDGPGLPAELVGQVFHEFRSAPVGPRRGGLGLGLALAREVARAHGGELEVAETGPRGTRFALYLPVGEPPDPRHRVA